MNIYLGFTSYFSGQRQTTHSGRLSPNTTTYKDDRKYQNEQINKQSKNRLKFTTQEIYGTRNTDTRLTEIYGKVYGKGKTTISKYKCQAKVKRKN